MASCATAGAPGNVGHGEGRDAKDHPVSFHRAQLEMLGVPPNLWEQLEKNLAAFGAGGSDLEGSFELTRDGQVAALADIKAGSQLWIIRHMLKAGSAAEVLKTLEASPSLLLEVAEAMQVLGDSDSDEGEEDATKEEEQEQAEAAGGSIYGSVFAAVKQELHRNVFMFEAPDGTRVRYMLEPLAMRLAVSREPELEVVPFMAVNPCGCGVQAVCLAWPVRDIAAGQVVARCKLPLGMADYSKQEFWEEAYRGEAGTDEWYGVGLPDILPLLQGHCPQLLLNSRGAAASGSSSTDTVTVAEAGTAELPTAGFEGGVLVAGCGNSELGVELWRAGVRPVVCADYVQGVVQLMADKFPPEAYPGLHWLQADLTDVRGTQLEGSAFAAIVDKATLDGLLTQDAHEKARWRGGDSRQLSTVSRYLAQLGGLLAPGGVLCVVSLRAPASLETVLQGAAAAQAQQCSACHGGTGAQPASCGDVSGSLCLRHKQAQQAVQEQDQAQQACGVDMQPQGGAEASVEERRQEPSEGVCEGISSSSLLSSGSITSSLTELDNESVGAGCESQGQGTPCSSSGPNSKWAGSSSRQEIAAGASGMCGVCGWRWQVEQHMQLPHASAHAYVCSQQSLPSVC